MPTQPTHLLTPFLTQSTPSPHVPPSLYVKYVIIKKFSGMKFKKSTGWPVVFICLLRLPDVLEVEGSIQRSTADSYWPSRGKQYISDSKPREIRWCTRWSLITEYSEIKHGTLIVSLCKSVVTWKCAVELLCTVYYTRWKPIHGSYH